MIPFAVMINGRSHVRGMVPGNVPQVTFEDTARQLPQIRSHVGERTIRKTIFVRKPNLIVVNFIV